MRKSTKPVMVYQCDWCGDTTPNFIVNAEHKHFCFEQTYGQEPTKDCLSNYVKDSKNKTPLFLCQTPFINPISTPKNLLP